MKNYRKGFSLIELLISITILSIVGWVSVSALHLMYTSFWQTDDHITARSEIEFAFNELRPQFTNIGLAMPNSKSGHGSFADAFTGLTTDIGSMTVPISVDNGGSRLLYAWAVPTGVKIGTNASGKIKIVAGDGEATEPLPISADALTDLRNFSYNGRNIGINSRPWILFPSLRIPLRIDTIGASSLTVTPTPNATLNFVGELRGFEEVHLLQIATIHVSGDKLLQDISGFGTKELANNIVSADFRFNDFVLTMTITALGNSVGEPGATGVGRYRNIVETMTWRIKN